MGENVKDFIKSIENFGFEKVLDIPFKNMHHEPPITEHMYIYFYKPYGIILQFDTFTCWRGDAPSVNSGHYYYQWRVSKEWVIEQERLALEKGTYSNTHHPCLSSGGYIYKDHPCEVFNMIWSGNKDCRSSMLYSIERLAECGEFITPWVKSDGIIGAPTFVHFGDHQTDSGASWDEGYRLYEQALVTESPKRFKMLPKYVQDAIKNGMRDKKLLDTRLREMKKSQIKKAFDNVKQPDLGIIYKKE